MRHLALALLALVFVPTSASLTAQGCTLAADINPTAAQSSAPTELHNRGGTMLLLAADDGIHGDELWRLDSGGAALVADIDPGPGNGAPWEFATFWNGSQLVTLFAADDGVVGRELWVTDGTGLGTALVLDIQSGVWSGYPQFLTVCNNRVFFIADDGIHGNELWISDGTTAGTTMVRDIYPGLLGSDPIGLTCAGGRLFFSAGDGTNGWELWISDGTSAGTTMVADIKPGGSSGSPFRLLGCGDRVAFGAHGSNGAELWASDGTAAGTYEVKDIRPGLASCILQDMVWTGDTLYFSANDGTNGQELWRSDLTNAGTVLVADIAPGAIGSGPSEFTVSQGRVFFVATTPFTGAATGTELWITDGTAAGTYEVLDIYPGGSSSSPSNLISVGTGICFRANELTTGRELWFSDGTAAGTTMVCDINPGSPSSFPGDMTISNGTLFFGAYDPTLGTELRMLQPPGGTVERLGQGCGPTYPIVDATNPVMGTTVLVTGRLAGQLGVQVLSWPSPPYTVAGILGVGCAAWVDPSSALGVGVTTTASWTYSTVFPVSPGFVGLGVRFQTFYLPFPLATDNGLQLTLGM